MLFFSFHPIPHIKQRKICNAHIYPYLRICCAYVGLAPSAYPPALNMSFYPALPRSQQPLPRPPRQRGGPPHNARVPVVRRNHFLPDAPPGTGTHGSNLLGLSQQGFCLIGVKQHTHTYTHKASMTAGTQHINRLVGKPIINQSCRDFILKF